MTNNRKIRMRELYEDAVTLILTLLLTVITGTIILITISGDRESGMVYGLYTGLTITVTLFFYLRTYFNFWVTLLQIIIGSALTFSETMLVGFIFSKTRFIELNYGYIFILTVIPILWSINKQVLDIIAEKLNAPKRKGKRFEPLK